MRWEHAWVGEYRNLSETSVKNFIRSRQLHEGTKRCVQGLVNGRSDETRRRMQQLAEMESIADEARDALRRRRAHQ